MTWRRGPAALNADGPLVTAAIALARLPRLAGPASRRADYLDADLIWFCSNHNNITVAASCMCGGRGGTFRFMASASAQPDVAYVMQAHSLTACGSPWQHQASGRHVISSSYVVGMGNDHGQYNMDGVLCVGAHGITAGSLGSAIALRWRAVSMALSAPYLRHQHRARANNGLCAWFSKRMTSK